MRYIPAAIICLLLAAACGEDDVPGAERSEQTTAVDTLEAVLRIGTDHGDSTEIFGMITDVAIDDEGNILVLDRTMANLRMYDGGGRFLRQVTRRGNGPGELVLPWDMFMFSDGRLMVLDPGKHGFLVFDDSLRFVEELQLWLQNQPFHSCAVSDSRFVSYKADLERTGTELLIRRRVALFTYGREDWDLLFWQDSLSLPVEDVMRERSLLYNSLEEPLTFCSDGSGTVYFSLKDTEDYSITAWNLSGEEVLHISLDLPRAAKTMEEMKAESTYVTGYWMSRGNVGPEWEFRPEPFKDMVTGVYIGPDGNLWARRGTARRPFFDIFDPSDGELLGHAVFPKDGVSWNIEVSPNGILAWEEDPEEGYQVLYALSAGQHP